MEKERPSWPGQKLIGCVLFCTAAWSAAPHDPEALPAVDHVHDEPFIPAGFRGAETTMITDSGVSGAILLD